MNLLAPWLLGGLAALAVPVLVHLIRRRDPRRTPFPSLMFMEGAPHEARGQRSLRDPWLLLLRLLALAAAVLAFAGPVLDTGSESAAVERSGDLVVALDRSMSMGYADRWDRAREKIEARLDAVEPGTRVGLVLFDLSAERAAPLELDTSSLRNRLAEAEPRAMGTDIRAGVAAAGALLAESDASNRALMLVSDFQRGAWRADGASLLPPGTQVEVVGVAGDDVVNSAVTDVRISAAAPEQAVPGRLTAERGQAAQDEGAASDESEQEPIKARAELEIVATVSRQGTGGPNWAALVVGGREIERVALGAANEVMKVRFEPLPAPRSPTAAAVRIQGDAFDADDVRHTVLAPEAGLTVLVVEDARRTAGEGSLYLRRALALAESPPIRVRSPASAQLAPADLVGADAIIVNDARLDERAHGLLEQYVREAGGGVLFIAGGRTGGAWPGGSGGYLPGELGGRVEAARDKPLAFVDRGGLAASEGLFDGFSLSGGSLGQVWRYRRLKTGTGDRVLLRYSDGGPALVERRAGLGRAMVLTSALDNRWNSMPVAPVFLPFAHRLMAELSGHEAPLRSFSTGSAVDIERWLETQPDAGPLRQALSAGDRLALKAPRGARDTLRDTDTVIQLLQPGVYELDRADGTGPELMWAANPAPRESELDAIDPGIVLNALVRMAAVQAPAVGDEGVSGSDAEGLALWRFALALALALLVLETWMSNRGAIVRSQPATVQ